MDGSTQPMHFILAFPALDLILTIKKNIHTNKPQQQQQKPKPQMGQLAYPENPQQFTRKENIRSVI